MKTVIEFLILDVLNLSKRLQTGSPNTVFVNAMTFVLAFARLVVQLVTTMTARPNAATGEALLQKIRWII